MTNEQAATKLTNIAHDDIYAWHPSVLEAFRMAVDALRGADGDLISRKEAIDRIESHLRTGNELYPFTYTDKVVNHGIEIAASCVYNMPSAQPTHNNTSNALKSLDCIDRQAAIDEVSKYASIWMEYDGGMTQEEVAEAALKAAKRTMVHILEELPSAQPSFSCDHEKDHIVEVGKMDCISRQNAIDAHCELCGDRGRCNCDICPDMEVFQLLPSAQPEQRWIPCSERLPEQYGNYLISIDGKDSDIGTINPNDPRGWSLCDANGFYWANDKALNITAWQTLPEPYREEGEADD